MIPGWVQSHDASPLGGYTMAGECPLITVADSWTIPGYCPGPVVKHRSLPTGSHRQQVKTITTINLLIINSGNTTNG